MNEWNGTYADLEKETLRKIKEVIELLLTEGTEEGYAQVSALFNNPDIDRFTKLDNDLFQIKELMRMYQEEQQNEVTKKIFEFAKTIEDIRMLWKNIVFSLYRLEQDLPVEYQNEAICYLAESPISPVTIYRMAEDKVADFEKFYHNLLEGLQRNGYSDFKAEVEAYIKKVGETKQYE